jgi:hypothetical protein
LSWSKLSHRTTVLDYDRLVLVGPLEHEAAAILGRVGAHVGQKVIRLGDAVERALEPVVVVRREDQLRALALLAQDRLELREESVNRPRLVARAKDVVQSLVELPRPLHHVHELRNVKEILLLLVDQLRVVECISQVLSKLGAVRQVRVVRAVVVRARRSPGDVDPGAQERHDKSPEHLPDDPPDVVVVDRGCPRDVTSGRMIRHLPRRRTPGDTATLTRSSAKFKG